MSVTKYTTPKRTNETAGTIIKAGLKHAKPRDYIDRMTMRRLQQLARGELARRIIVRLESYKGERLSPIKKLAVLLRITKKLKRKPTQINEKMMDGIIDELIMDALQNTELSNEELGRLLNQWRKTNEK